MKTYIVLADVNSFDRRNFAEDIEDKTFNTFDEFKNFIGDEREINGCYNLLYYNLSDFMDMCNDQEINLENYWVTYINIKSD